jgi:hypothetical protein
MPSGSADSAEGGRDGEASAREDYRGVDGPFIQSLVSVYSKLP